MAESDSPNKAKADACSKLDSILLSINKMVPIVQKMEDNLPGLIHMKEVFDKESQLATRSRYRHDISDNEDNDFSRSTREDSEVDDISDIVRDKCEV